MPYSQGAYISRFIVCRVEYGVQNLINGAAMMVMQQANLAAKLVAVRRDGTPTREVIQREAGVENASGERSPARIGTDADSPPQGRPQMAPKSLRGSNYLIAVPLLAINKHARHDFLNNIERRPNFWVAMLYPLFDDILFDRLVTLRIDGFANLCRRCFGRQCVYFQKT